MEDISEDFEDLSEGVEEITEEEQLEEERKAEQKKTLVDIQTDLHKLVQDIERLRKNDQPPTPPSSS